MIDPWLSEFKDALKSRHSLAMKWIKTIKETEGGLDQFSKGYNSYGFNVASNGDIVYREWAPNAEQAFLIGDFSESMFSRLCARSHTDFPHKDSWNRDSHPMKRNAYGVWEITLPGKNGQPMITHDSKIKVREHPCLIRNH